MRRVRQVLRELVGAEGAHADARRPAVQVRLLREEAQEQDVAGGAPGTPHLLQHTYCHCSNIYVIGSQR